MLVIKKLYIDHRENPLGIDTPEPRFTWSLESDNTNVLQESYQIRVSGNNRLFWDSGRVESSESIGISYVGFELEELTVYTVSLKVWDNGEECAKIESQFETSYFDESRLTAQWITYQPKENAKGCQIFRKNFTCSDSISRARLFSSSCGVYDVMLNGLKVGNEFLSPGWTNYKRHIQYQEYDITGMLQDSNVIDITVAPGWYSGDFGGNGRTKNYGDQTAVFAEIHIWYGDRKEIIRTDESWKWGVGQTLNSEIYHGETIDHRKQTLCEGEVVPFDIGERKLIAQQSPPVRIINELEARDLIHTPNGETVIDFGQNLSGFVELTIQGKEGMEVLISHGEVLDRDGNFYNGNLRTARAADKFICKEGLQRFRPRFTYHGFRYIKVEGLGTDPSLSWFKACVLSTDMEGTVEFSCSHPLINQLWSNINWGMDGNFVDIPTDCPQRDERLGWTGDAAAFIGTAAQLRDVYLFFRKWLKDLESEQSDEYGIPHIIPNILGERGGAAMWSDSATIIPWTLYQIYGDKEILELQYDSMKRWVDLMERQETPNHLRQTGYQFGDWLAMDTEQIAQWPYGATDPYFIASLFYAYSTQIVSKTAALLGYKKDARRYGELYGKIRKGIQEEYITRTGRLVCETQTACLLALRFDLVPEEHREKVKYRLIENIINHGKKLTTGFIGTPFALHVLTSIGAHDIAGDLLLNEEYPGWLYEVKKGATTIWERWDSMKPDGSFNESGMNSFNHYAFGSIGSWMIEQLAGIGFLEAGYKSIRLKPLFINGLTEVSARRETPYGTLSCSWKCTGGEILIQGSIPVNTTAELHLPEKEEVRHLGSGSFSFRYPTKTDLEQR